MDDEQLLRSIVQRGGDTTDLERELSTFLVQLLFLFVPFPMASENSSSSRSTSRHLSLRSSFSFPFPLPEEDGAFCNPDKICVRCCSLESPWTTLHLHANI